MFNEILAGEGIPQEWNSAYKCSIHKKGNKNNCNNYRAVSIINSTGRLFSEVIKDKIENMIKTKISEEQAGFKTRKFSLDNIFCLQQIISKQHKRKKEINLVFVDLEKAYDMVPRKLQWSAIRRMEIPQEIIVVTQKSMKIMRHK
jgi:sorting nexin-29